MLCRTVEEAYAAGQLAARDDPPLSQQQADFVYAILFRARAREQQGNTRGRTSPHQGAPGVRRPAP